jgi:hypothetical protein
MSRDLQSCAFSEQEDAGVRRLTSRIGDAIAALADSSRRDVSREASTG